MPSITLPYNTRGPEKARSSALPRLPATVPRVAGFFKDAACMHLIKRCDHPAACSDGRGLPLPRRRGFFIRHAFRSPELEPASDLLSPADEGCMVN